jgi:hypothetical protein
MPVTGEPRSRDGFRFNDSWHWLSKQVGCWAFQKYGYGILAGIRTVLSHHRGGFDWKEIAASLHISGSVADDNFWSEMKRIASNRRPQHIASDVTQQPKAPDAARTSHSKTSP